MAKTCVDIMKDASEIVHYDTAGIPIYIRTGRLTEYPDKRALCHWHEDIEWIRVLKGRMNYRVNNQKILLQEQDCLMVCPRQMHYGYSCNGEDCAFLCILFHPQLFAQNQLLHEEYIRPYLENTGLESLYFNMADGSHRDVRKALDRIAELKEEARPGYELEITGIMHMLWGRLINSPLLTSVKPEPAADADLTAQRDMVSCINRYYAEKLTLADIAASGHVSRSKCCAIFKRYLQQSPIDFLNRYRLEVSRDLLQSKDLNITQIATSCGFNHLSYYSKLFAQNYGCTPSEYRRLQCSNL